MDIKCYSQYDPPPVVLEDYSDVESIVDKDGNLSTEDLVNQFLEAGDRLKNYRAYMYAEEKNVDDNDTGYDELNKIDTYQKVSSVVNNLKNRKVEIKNENVMKSDDEEKDDVISSEDKK